MERTIKSVLEAKRLFIVKPTLQAIHDHNITPEEIIFWFKTMYPDRLEEARQAIKYWKEKQILV
jgi:hypothetical protein